MNSPTIDISCNDAWTAVIASIEQASSAVLAADVDDLTNLAAAHSCFQQITDGLSALNDAVKQPKLGNASAAASTLVEKIILREAADPEEALRSLQATVRELQGIVSSGASHAPATSGGKGEVRLGAAAPSASPPALPTVGMHSSDLDESDTALNPDDVALALEFISEASTHIESAEAKLLQLEESPGDQESVNAIFRSFHTIKGVAGFMNLRQIGALAHAAENLLDLARKGKLELAGAMVDLVLESADLLKALLMLLDAAIKAQSPISREPRLASLIQRLHAAAANGTTDVAVASTQPVIEKTPTMAAEGKPPVSGGAGRAGEAAHGDGTVKVSTERLDSLINMVGELVISQSMVSQDVTALAATQHRVLRNLSHLGKITRELQDLSMSMRMVPVGGVFQKMARVVRDISRKAGKEVEFIVSGGDTELDRNVVEAIGDPLVHMVRNSVDHGIESPDDRVAAGKNRAGRLELRARHQSGQIVVEIVDDGKGLNTAKILKKATEAGIVKEGEVLSEQQIFQLIFAAGLSTADKITDISGRGVGMDVVRKNVEALRGRIDIRSVPGQGATFTISLPLTLAIIDGMVVRVGSERYIVPINSIEQSIRPKAEQLSTVQGRGELCMVRDRLLPVVRLHRLFSVQPRTENPTEALVVIVHDNDRGCCLLVDELLGQQQVVIKSLGESIGNVPGVSGGAILGDGSISLILDVPAVIGLATNL